MNDCFDKQKIMSYAANVLSNSAFVRDKFEDVCEWMEKRSLLCCRTKVSQATKKIHENFEDFAKANYRKALDVIKCFGELLQTQINKGRKYRPSLLEQNLINLQNLFQLTEIEKELLGLLIREDCDDLFDDLLGGLKQRHSEMTIQLLAMFLAVQPKDLYAICRKDSLLCKLGFLEIDYKGKAEISDMAKFFFFQKFETQEDIKKHLIGKPASATLQWEDFAHIQATETVEKILRAALKRKEKGINILFYGEPGTGKTEFAKTLANKVSSSLYSIGNCQASFIEDENKKDRHKQLLQAQLILEKEKNASLLIDEADDILGSDGGFFFRSVPKADPNKIRINRLLETNPQPIIWITNDIRSMDKAYLRRFTYAINFTRPKRPVIEDMWRKSLSAHGLASDEKTAKDFAERYSLAPSFIASAVRSAKLINGGLKEVEQTLDVLQQVYNNGKEPKGRSQSLKTPFNTKLLNTDIDLEKLADRIASLKKSNFSLCLYGASGTGKSAFAQYLGEKLGLPVIKKRCSDLISSYVGETEQNIALAFREAKSRGALLIFDEADSFLQDRTSAVRSWEITQVNEMLTQMESHPFPFVCTTNLMDRLDKASLRRFTFKVKYNSMSEEQRSLAFEHFFGISGVNLAHLSSLTPADFVVVKEKAEILDCLENQEELVQMLEQEQLNKAPVSRKIGFI